MRTAKFWTLANGDLVKIKIQQGKTISWYSAHSTDEGWSAEGETYSFDGEYVTREWISDGRDCDGRLTNGGENICRIDRLQSHEYDGNYFPQWEDGDSYKRDEYAEMDGY